MALTTDQVRELLTQPEGERLEFKAFHDPRGLLKNAQRLAPVVAGFANADGGVLLLGHDPENRSGRNADLTPGVGDVDLALRAVDRMLSVVTPSPVTEVSVHDVDGRQLVAVEVRAGAAPLYLGAGEAVRRLGSRLVPLTAHEVERQLGSDFQTGSKNALNQLLVAVNEQSALVAQLRQDLARATSSRRQWQYGLVFLLLGTAVSVVIAVLGG